MVIIVLSVITELCEIVFQKAKDILPNLKLLGNLRK